MAEKNYAKDYCPADIMASFMARDLTGIRETGVGTFSVVPWVAIRWAQTTNNPDLFFIDGPAGSVNCKFDKIAPYVGDYRYHVGAEYRFSLEYVMDNFNDTHRKKDLAFFGGFQIDKYGNVNMTVIGDPQRPKFRGPGTVGLMGMCFWWPIDIFTHYHTPRLFVDKVDFISGPGYGNGPGWREKMGCLGGGPRHVITPIAIFDFDEETKIMRLKSVHPGHTVEEVKSRMGFSPIIPAHVPQTELPTVEEVAFYRRLDPDGILPKITEA